jgi:ADP-ribosylglycohydrolase
MIAKENIRNSMLWAAYGDALGFISELAGHHTLSKRIGTNSVEKLVPWKRKIGGKYGTDIYLPQGCYSDDTQLRLAVCRSIRGNGSFDVDAFAKVELPVWLSYALGAGRGSQAAANSLFRQDRTWCTNFYKTDDLNYLTSGGNGAAMRIQPHVWVAPHDEDNSGFLLNVIRDTVVTHGHLRAIAGALFHSLSLRYCLLNRHVPPIQEWGRIADQLEAASKLIENDEQLGTFWLPSWEQQTSLSFVSELKSTIEEIKFDVDAIQRVIDVESREEAYLLACKAIGAIKSGATGSATKTALLANLVALLFVDNPSAGMRCAANVLESDTDTIATMAGALLGAVTDAEIPEPVMDQKYLESEAERIFQISRGASVGSFRYPDLLLWKMQKSQIDVVGQREDKIAVSGLGFAERVNDLNQAIPEKFNRYWIKLEFGQTIFAKMRPELRVLADSHLPSTNTHVQKVRERQVTTASSTDEITADRMKEIVQPPKQQPLPFFTQDDRTYLTVDQAYIIALKYRLEARMIGNLLLQLAEQQNGIDQAIGFAGLVARAKQAQNKKHEGG